MVDMDKFYFILASWAIILVGTMVSHSKSQADTVHDVGYSIIPRYDIPFNIVNLIAVLVLTPLLFSTNDVRLNVLWTVLYFSTLTMLIRAITINLTILPPSDEACDREKFSIIELLHGHCSDKIFSGHQSVATIIGLAMMQAGLISPLTGLAHSGIVGALLIATRAHYSVDVFLGFLIPVLLMRYKL